VHFGLSNWPGIWQTRLTLPNKRLNSASLQPRFFTVERHDAVARCVLDKPPANALDAELHADFALLLDLLERDEGIRAVVLASANDRIFMAGAKLEDFPDEHFSAEQTARRVDLAQRTFLRVQHLPQPVVAEISGHALGGGCELALACDFRVCSSDAKLGQPEILLGIIPGAGGTQRLSRLVGTSRAKDLIFSGRFVSADEALAIGLVDEVVATAEEVYPAARRRVERFATGPAFALRAAKEAIDRGLEVDIATGLEIERMQFAALFATRDREIGMTSFVESGPGKAVFEGQ
jgi:enoyl-CoA hydratase/carnithine racemase